VKFLVDEDVPVEVARSLQQAGHETALVAEVLGIWHHALRNGFIVVTCNRQDFLRLAGAAPETGLIILNRRRTRQAESRHVLDLLSRAGESGLSMNINIA